ncbi:hypothetical protein HW555_006162 [Spodoptera exigua]|uniref:Uncharacterized protein n=1 Tax=Spodoptera exigua TaxID=7107 RepID=A0A835L6Q5_SPOEX|nr:hypothetical protein HW555_006162 [Spodoptera exigua]
MWRRVQLLTPPLAGTQHVMYRCLATHGNVCNTVVYCNVTTLLDVINNILIFQGVVLKTPIQKPKKPNSANRKCVLERLSNGK